MPVANDRPRPCAKHHDPSGFWREAPVARSLWKLAGTFLWVRITDKFLPSCFIRYTHTTASSSHHQFRSRLVVLFSHPKGTNLLMVVFCFYLPDFFFRDWHCGHSNLVAILGILLFLLYHAYSQYSDRCRRALRRRFGKIAYINEVGTTANRRFVLDSGSFFHATGDMSFLDQASLALGRLGTIIVGNGSVLEVFGHGSINLPNLALTCVLYVPGLIVNVVSVRQLMELDYQVQFIGNEFFVREICTDAMVGRGQLGGGMYQVDSLNVPLDRGRCINCLLLGRLYDHS
ncbi:unnamed protein product [Urochloa decumbens]|uniref:Retrovirus-related Pol polyprotein from transposon TNT 1-94-like beta-barrel domain-containing protein n=1 Tax=Urochloa decumbens TaxID=240449 RepID=A0ABC9ATZ5_9POAL